jgi:hypothetical protein
MSPSVDYNDQGNNNTNESEEIAASRYNYDHHNNNSNDDNVNANEDDGSHDDFYIARLNISHSSACMIIRKKIAIRYELYQKTNALIILTDEGILIKRLRWSDIGIKFA